jgi:prepilin-type N-terminal cleavage/methylation domain-containing protein
MKGQSKKKGENGFTLVELLVVVAILAVISGIAIPSYSRHLNKSKVLSELAAIKSAMHFLAADSYLWPGGNDPFVCPRNLTPSQNGVEYADLTANDVGLFNNNGTVFAIPEWDGPYLQSSYLDPGTNKFLDPWGTPYWLDYDYQESGEYFVAIVSSGPNKSAVNVYDSDNYYIPIGR